MKKKKNLLQRIQDRLFKGNDRPQFSGIHRSFHGKRCTSCSKFGQCEKNPTNRPMAFACKEYKALTEKERRIRRAQRNTR